MDSARVAVAIMAAGKSTRFGANKLEAMLGSKMLGLAIADTLAPLGFGARFAMTSGRSKALALSLSQRGFEIIDNPDPDAGLSYSIKLAAAAAMGTSADALMVCLADMPFVDANCVRTMLASYSGEALIATDGSISCPPAILPRSLWASLAGLDGDTGARALFANARQVLLPKNVLRDIDVREDLVLDH